MANKVNEFLKEMTNLTGKYGDELFDFIREKIGTKPETSSTQKVAVGNLRGKYEFSGSRKELIELLKLRGADCYGVSAASPYGLCIYAARVFEVNEFVWHRPIQKRDVNGKVSYSADTETAFLDDEGNEIFTY